MPKKSFDIARFEELASTIHDIDIDMSASCTKMVNKLTSRICHYIDKYEPITPNIVTDLITLLSHPKKHVRVVAACHLVGRGYVVGWPVLVREAQPDYFPAKNAPIEEWRNFNASGSALLYISTMYRSIEHLPLYPPLEEVLVKWKKRNGLGLTSPILEKILLPNILIRS